MALRHAQRGEPGLAQIVVVLEGEARLAIVFVGARGEAPAAELAAPLDRRRLPLAEPHRKLSRRKPSTAALNAWGCSRLLRWPALAMTLSLAPGMRSAMGRGTPGGVNVSSAPTTTWVGTSILSRSGERS